MFSVSPVGNTTCYDSSSGDHEYFMATRYKSFISVLTEGNGPTDQLSNQMRERLTRDVSLSQFGGTDLQK